MEQQLDSSYLARDYLDRSLGFAIRVFFLGLGIFLAAWGVSSVWRAAQQSAEVHIVIPEVRPAPLETSPTTSVQSSPEAKTSSHTEVEEEPIIRREVTVFTFVRHARGSVVTGWSYKDGAAGKPTRQFCYFSSPNSDHTKTLVDLAIDRKQLPSINEAVVPNVEDALLKCQWFGD
jgi:hypothetical protein